MRRTETKARRSMIQRVVAVALVGIFGAGLAACSSTGGASRTQNAPNQNGPSQSPTTAAPSSGGAGF